MVKFIKSRNDAGSGPSSAIGIMRFFDANSKSPQLNPYFVIGIVVIFVIALLALQLVL